ncbi:protein kinase [Myxococcus sp. XM-1-1-1]|uniref:serine/threonine protein kinase n=1 Tax=Myxococcus sp. XM-1-1-1 TaxID=2874602 RepID=UPI001CBBC85A|nr:serine/threonine-protein kinase [Myxococcus sp. XM-1-1-1]MBZ4414698.1 protein kinase [Myxococcus sp. XM-1-1-1]
MAAGDESWLVHLDELGPGTLIDTWRVVERLGAGGYGAVYKVEHVAEPGAWYALKLALHRRDKRTHREEQLLMGKAMHPNVVRLHAIGRWPHPANGNPYFVMSWVDGLALDTWAETLNPSFRQLAEKAGKVALALGALHERGVLHRDLKPEHILIRQSDGEPILIDLGVGYFAGADTLTLSVLPPATPHLLSPEAVTFLRTHHQLRGARYQTKPTDELHALGVLLYRVVTGHYPYSPNLPVDLLYAAIESTVPPAPSEFNRRVPRALSDLLMRLLAKSPRERLQTGQEVHEALVAAVTFGLAAAWEASLFEWEELPPAEGQGVAQRRIRRPQWPTESSTPPPREPVLKRFLHMSMARERRSEVVPDKAQSAGVRGPRSRGWPYFVLVVALAVGIFGVKVLGWWPFSPHVEAMPEAPRVAVAGLPHGLPGHEVAQQVKSPETASTAAPPEAVPTPAVVATPATHVEDEVSVKKTVARPSTPTTQSKSTGLGSMGKTLCVGVTSAALACTGAQVRPEPPPEPCPPGAVAAMEKLGIRVGNEGLGTFFFEAKNVQPTTVTEGMVNVSYARGLGDMPQNSRLSGRLIFGERVYGRLTRARSKDGTIDIPVCLELWDRQGGRGLIDLGKRGPTTATVLSTVDLKAVREFE